MRWEISPVQIKMGWTNGPAGAPRGPDIRNTNTHHDQYGPSRVRTCKRTPRQQTTWTTNQRRHAKCQSRSYGQNQTPRTYQRTKPIPHPVEPGRMLHRNTASRKKIW